MQNPAKTSPTNKNLLNADVPFFFGAMVKRNWGTAHWQVKVSEIEKLGLTPNNVCTVTRPLAQPFSNQPTWSDNTTDTAEPTDT